MFWTYYVEWMTAVNGVIHKEFKLNLAVNLAVNINEFN